MGDVLDAAKDIVDAVRDEAPAEGRPMGSFVDQYAPPPEDHPYTRVLIGDAEIRCVGHSKNKAACVAISAVVQTTAGIGKELECVTEVVLDDSDRAQPIYSVNFVPGPVAVRVINGFVRAIAGIEKTAPGSLRVYDSRKRE